MNLAVHLGLGDRNIAPFYGYVDTTISNIARMIVSLDESHLIDQSDHFEEVEDMSFRFPHCYIGSPLYYPYRTDFVEKFDEDKIDAETGKVQNGTTKKEKKD